MKHSMEELTIAGCTSRRGVRHWESLGLLGEVERTDGDTRRYTDEQLERARIIAAGQFGGFALDEIKGMIEEYNATPEAHEALLVRLSDQMRAAARLLENLPKPRVPVVEYDL